MLPKQASGYRWFPISIAFGLGLVIPLLVNAISNYRFVSDRVQVDQLRQDTASMVTLLEQQVQINNVHSAVQLNSLLREMRKNGSVRIAWIQLRRPDDSILAQSGYAMTPTFSSSYVRLQYLNRKSVYRTLHHEAGTVVVEAFPFRIPSALEPPIVAKASTRRTATVRQTGVLEVAAFLDSGKGHEGPAPFALRTRPVRPPQLWLF
jgi:hypothetical protein